MIEIHLFEQLAAFADCGTLSAAAEQLHISQPALSRSMQRLEEELGVSLFERQKSRLTLNETGELAVRYARNLLLQEQSMIQQLQDFDRKRRTICVGSCAPVLIPDFVTLLSRLYKGMTISTELTGDPRLPEYVREGRYQMAILHEKPEGEKPGSARSSSTYAPPAPAERANARRRCLRGAGPMCQEGRKRTHGRPAPLCCLTRGSSCCAASSQRPGHRG